MMKFGPVPCPPDFNVKCRQPGLAWLANNPKARRPPGYWSPFRAQLRKGFRGLCAYTCMPAFNGGSVDHYLSWKRHPQRAYDWENYRFVAGWINSSKGSLDDAVLDPFQVEDEWFEIILPSLQLVLTDAVPPQHRARAEFTLKRLHLRDGEQVIELRQELYQRYQAGELPLPLLREWAPLIARAVEKQMAQEQRKSLREKLEEAKPRKLKGKKQQAKKRKPLLERVEEAATLGTLKRKGQKKEPKRRRGSE